MKIQIFYVRIESIIQETIVESVIQSNNPSFQIFREDKQFLSTFPKMPSNRDRNWLEKCVVMHYQHLQLQNMWIYRIQIPQIRIKLNQALLSQPKEVLTLNKMLEFQISPQKLQINTKDSIFQIIVENNRIITYLQIQRILMVQQLLDLFSLKTNLMMQLGT